MNCNMLDRVNRLLGTRFTELNWSDISYYQVLSEDFIREFKDKVNWSFISSEQVLSFEFIKEFEDKVYWGILKEKGITKIIVNNHTLVNEL